VKLATTATLMSVVIALSACATDQPPPGPNPFADLTPSKTYKELKVALVYTDHTKAAVEYVQRHRWSPHINLKALSENMQAPFSRIFKSVERVQTLAEARTAHADVVAFMDMNVYLPDIAFGEGTVEFSVSLVTPEGKPIDTATAKSVNNNYLRVDEKLARTATAASQQLERALSGSSKLAAYAEARAEMMATAKPQTVPAPQSSTVSTAPASDVDTLPSAKGRPHKNAYAIVIGIEQYREKLPKADFADRDAKLVGEYLTKVMGYPEENVVVRTNDKASLTDLIKYFENWLPNNVEKDSSVFVYYSGHGAPNPKTGDAYMVPYDGDPTFVDSTGYPMKRLYAALDKLPVKDVTVVLDSCFSGAGGRSVLAKGAKPMGLSVDHSLGSIGKTLVLAASAGDQISSAYEEKGHGLLTYFFLKGLQGEGDLNKDGNVDMAELYEYVKPSVSRIARKQYNNEQTPQLLGSPDALKRGGRLIERASP